MEVILKSRKRRVKKPVIRDHYWYDPETRQRLHGRGGRMIFVYDSARKKSIPKIVDAEDWVWEDSYDDILQWISKNNVELVSKVPGRYVVVDVDVNNWSDMEDDLYRHKITYDYDDRELKKESKSSTRSSKWQNSASRSQIRLFR